MSAIAQKLREGDLVQDGRAEATIVDIPRRGAMIEIEYTDTHDRIRLQKNRFQRESDGSIVVV